MIVIDIFLKGFENKRVVFIIMDKDFFDFEIVL